jgi:hypothetical protein
MRRISSLIVTAAALLFVLPLLCPAGAAGLINQARENASTSRFATRDHPPREPYAGEWSNGRGETLIITGSTIKFGRDKAVSYRDVTRVTNGREFHLEITTDGKLNYLTKFLHISFGDGNRTDEMKMTLYNSRKDMEDGQNSQGEATWDRDK